MSKLLAISPLDGRYRDKGTYKERAEELSKLSEFVSEYALIKARLGVEAKYLFALSKIGVVSLSQTEKSKLLKVLKGFDLKEAEKIKKIEDECRHDVKAIEIYLSKVLSNKTSEMIHFGLTSEDVNNLAYRITLRNASDEMIIPYFESLIDKLFLFAKDYSSIPMLARTHGQSAVPTTLGKEFAVFAQRISLQTQKLGGVELTGKLNGAVGNYNSLQFVYPNINWVNFSKNFVESLGFKFTLLTTQIQSPEDIIEYFQILRRINGILLDLCNDLWRYISDGWFMLSSRRGQVVSSTMPQKVNPIDFENSEGNLEIANGLIEVFERKLPISRLQRDLSGSTILRNMGVILAHSLFSYKGIYDGLSKISPNKEKMKQDLESDWSILSEALQTFLRKEGKKDSYLRVMEKTKGRRMSEADWKNLLKELGIKDKKLLTLSPKKYIGLADKLAKFK
ncbi:MAG: Adenylosuccinate lyase [Candidatus Levybacteria bacterium GW2011_GWA2_40_8]|nr:MAG: Adenylosuccinate lyase [Candidatus Levybacteria bacterium GW2011_GWA2_40_8]